MALTDPGSRAVGYLILRHLYDGDIIDWPVEDAHPQRHVFADLEEQGLIARWDRVWPLQDRYRLTETGIAAIEAVYRPEGAEAFFNELRQRNMSPADRRNYIASRGLDPFLWPLLHDPWTHWSTFLELGAAYYTYVWEDQRPPQRTRHQTAQAGASVQTQTTQWNHQDPYYQQRHDPYDQQRAAAALVDLDNEADDLGYVAPEQGDYDVS